MSKYQPLQAYLAAIPATEVPMTFSDIERVIGAPLPPLASDQRAWWSNNPSNNVMTKAWLAAGFKTESVDMKRRRLVFRRADGRRRTPENMPSAAAAIDQPAVVDQAGRQLFGRLKGTVRIAVDVDLTAPADPAWGAGA